MRNNTWSLLSVRHAHARYILHITFAVVLLYNKLYLARVALTSFLPQLGTRSYSLLALACVNLTVCKATRNFLLKLTNTDTQMINTNTRSRNPLVSRVDRKEPLIRKRNVENKQHFLVL